MVVGLTMAVAISAVSNPLPTPSAFVSQKYGLTFRRPRSRTSCALPKDWVGADHGTVIFLVPPKRCDGAGFSASGRGFDGNAPPIEVFYGYALAEDEKDQRPPPCRAVGHVDFLGKPRSLCQTTLRPQVKLMVSANYLADQPAEATLTLVTSRARLEADLLSFEALLRSAQTCTATWRDDKGGKSFTPGSGSGPACPTEARWF